MTERGEGLTVQVTVHRVEVTVQVTICGEGLTVQVTIKGRD